jgi:nitrite reductase/ring-hydroxylating ferredoxin subunit
MTQPNTGTQGGTTGDVSRRSLIRGVALGGAALPLLAACGGGGDSADAKGSGGSGGSGGSDDSGGSSDSGGSGGAGGTTVAKSDVPVGGGKVLTQDKVVVTQPSKGVFAAFTAICTHQGCTVGKIENGEIICPCHLSHFSIKDGSNTQGPNDTPAGSVQPLAKKKVTAKGDQLSIS